MTEQATIFETWEESPRTRARLTRYEHAILDAMKTRGRTRITSSWAGRIVHQTRGGCPSGTALNSRSYQTFDCCLSANTDGGHVLAGMEKKELLRKLDRATYQLVELGENG